MLRTNSHVGGSLDVKGEGDREREIGLSPTGPLHRRPHLIQAGHRLYVQDVRIGLGQSRCLLGEEVHRLLVGTPPQRGQELPQRTDVSCDVGRVAGDLASHLNGLAVDLCYPIRQAGAFEPHPRPPEGRCQDQLRPSLEICAVYVGDDLGPLQHPGLARRARRQTGGLQERAHCTVGHQNRTIS